MAKTGAFRWRGWPSNHSKRNPNRNQRDCKVCRRRSDYCDRLLVGQYILERVGEYEYRPHTAASYTKGKRCPGIGGLR